ncbi:MAG: RHS repeat-associated core domain-containing protein, partial [Saprospiraceae bacterium]|nr:RHS repeat-associated core domain-containing protein [Saprospiraceae bacterium]
PTEYTAANWPVETYEWQNGLIKKRTYENFIWQNAYHTGTRLLASTTDVDGQVTAFTYDPLMRLSSTSSKGGNVLSYYTYQYKNGTNPYSFIQTQTDYTAVTGSSLTSKVSIQYFDGLGRLLETVDKKRSANSKDVVSAFEYDHQNRLTKKYNPFESGLNTGAFATVPAGTPFEQTQYESTPLNREKIKTAPAGFPIFTTTYGANGNNEVYQSLSGLSYFPANSLYKTTVSVAQSSSVTLESSTYKDRQGRVILDRKAQQGSSTNKADTYSEYDDKGRLVQVVPPGAATGNALCFRYTYDWSDNMLTKAIPDKGLTTMKYNTRDQLALDQDANLNSASQWRCTQYDNYGRVIKAGIFSGTVPATIDQTLAPTTSYVENTYDGTTAIEKGKIKTAKVRVLSASLPWVQMTYAYDAYGRVIQASGNNHITSVLGTEINNFTAYDWAGNLLAENRITSNGAVSRTISQEHTYDHWGRLKTHKHLLGAPGSGSFTTISELSYDVLDRIKENNVGKTPGATQPLQSLDFGYNNNGWLTNMNNVILNVNSTALVSCPGTQVSPNPDPSGSSSTPDNNDLFYIGLFYNSLQTGLPGTAQSNGNIAQVVWRTRGRERQAYALSYDFLDRMDQAAYNDFSDANATKNTLNAYREKLNYDLRGNITTLVRNGKYMPSTCWQNGQIDSLIYAITPTSNKLQSITDAAPAASKAYGWNNTAGAAAGAVFGYDGQGNLNADPYKGITSIVYNKYLNLPETITFAGGKSIVLLYDASGKKLRKTVNIGGLYQYIQDYVNGIEYRTTLIKPITLESIAHPEGRVFNTNVTASSTTEVLRYEYSIRDHLGNVRISYTDKNANGKVDVTNNSTTNEILQENHYYPFGMNMEGPWINDAALDNRYQYNGKEYNNDFGLNWNDYGARWYDPTVGRWWSVDKLSDHPAQVGLSPYQYGWNSPVKLNDPDGNIPCAQCIAFVVGALVEYGTQVATNMTNGHDFKSALTHDINGWKILTSGTASAVSLGISNSANTARASATVIKQLAVDGAESVAKQAIDGDKIDAVKTFTDVLGSQIGGNVSRSADFSVNAKPFQKDATRAAKIAANDPLSAGRQKTAKEAKDLASTARQVNNASVGVSELVGETTENASQASFDVLRPKPAASIIPDQMNPPRMSTDIKIIRRDLRVN